MKISYDNKRDYIPYLIWIIFFIIAVIILVQGVFFLKPGDEAGYCLLDFYLLLPLAAFVGSVVLGRCNNRLRWFTPLFFGCTGVALPYIVFHSIARVSLFFGFVPSIAGLFIGVLFGIIHTGKAAEQ